MTPRVLLVEDDASVREAVSIVLERAGFAVEAVGNGADAIGTFGRDCRFEVVVLDIMLPGVNGYDVCREIRKTSGVPIIMLTARADTADVVVGLELGADDYITKPFEPAELAARVRAVLRRSGHELAPDGSTELRGRDLVVDEGSFRAFRGGEELALTKIELQLLASLLRNTGNVLTREALLDRVWGYDYLGDSRLVDMAVKRLRQKLGDPDDGPPYISTVRGVGYRFERG